jgi:hypothetical protein
VIGKNNILLELTNNIEYALNEKIIDLMKLSLTNIIEINSYDEKIFTFLCKGSKVICYGKRTRIFR